MDKIKKEIPVKKGTYGGFWIRGLALLIDTFIILFPINLLIGLIFGYETLKNPHNLKAGILQIVLYSLITIILWYFNKSAGKKGLNLFIVEANTFKKPPLWRLIIRFFSYFLSMISLIGFFIGLFRKDKRTLHDLISGTVVVRKS
jgi:uncharacterized RDD family membrane protein YckC